MLIVCSTIVLWDFDKSNVKLYVCYERFLSDLYTLCGFECKQILNRLNCFVSSAVSDCLWNNNYVKFDWLSWRSVVAYCFDNTRNDLFIAAPLCALVVAITNNIGVFTGDVNFVQTYMSGFSGFIASWFFMFYLARYSVNSWKTQGQQMLFLAGLSPVVSACRIGCCASLRYFDLRWCKRVCGSVFCLPYGGEFVWINLPRRFIPAAMAFGSVTFTMTSAGSPEIQNWIPIKYLGFLFCRVGS